LPCTHTLTALDLTQTLSWYHSKDKPFCLKFAYSNAGTVETKHFIVKRLGCYKDNFISRYYSWLNRVLVLDGFTDSKAANKGDSVK